MATPFVAGAAALALAHLAATDYKYFNRGAEIRAFLKAASAASPALTAGGGVQWGDGYVPNGIIDWVATCTQLAGGTMAQTVATGVEKVVQGTYTNDVGEVDTKAGVLEAGSDYPRTQGAAHANGVTLSLFADAGDATPDVFAAPNAPAPEYEKYLPTHVDFGSAVGGALLALLRCRRVLLSSFSHRPPHYLWGGHCSTATHTAWRETYTGTRHAGLQGVLADEHPLKAALASNFAAKVVFEYQASAGATLLRLRCPSKGAIFIGSGAVFRTDGPAADEVLVLTLGLQAYVA